MNILLISRCPPYPLHLGDRLIVFHLARQLAQRGHIIDLIAFSDRFEDIAERGHYADLFRSITIVADPPRTSFDYAARWLLPNRRFPQTEPQAWSPAMWHAIRQHVEANTYDLVHLYGGIQVYEYAHAVEPLPAIITPYESYSLYLRRVVERADADAIETEGSRLQKRITLAKLLFQWHITRSFESWMFTPFRRVIVVSARDRDELLGLRSQLPVDVIPNGVDLDYFQPQNEPREPNTLVFTGNYEYAPNVDAALRLAAEIFPQVRAQIPNAKLWLVGNAPPPELQALADDTITVTGHVPDLRAYLNRATVFVSPLRLGAGIKNKILEALALACPVVATPLSVDGIAALNNDELLIADTDAQIVSAVLRLLMDQNLRKHLGATGRTLIEARYSWAQVAERYEAVYREITA
ncbi:MAG: glycosyltransferase [Chloroflexi bacterium]|nr:glycosyltransferase [Chloroflexota bacterium]